MSSLLSSHSVIPTIHITKMHCSYISSSSFSFLSMPKLVIHTKDYSLTVLHSFIYISFRTSYSEILFHVTSNLLTCINSLSVSLLFMYGMWNPKSLIGFIHLIKSCITSISPVCFHTWAAITYVQYTKHASLWKAHYNFVKTSDHKQGKGSWMYTMKNSVNFSLAINQDTINWGRRRHVLPPQLISNVIWDKPLNVTNQVP
jgi:hypothetical protein